MVFPPKFITDNLCKYVALILFILYGINKPKIIDKRKDKSKRLEGIVVFNHKSFIDPHLLVYALGPYSCMMAGDLIYKVPLLKRYAKKYNIIAKEEKNNSIKIKKFLDENPGKLFCISPEGGLKNLDSQIGKFFKGAFLYTEKVTPIVIKFDNDTFLWKYKNNIKDWFMEKMFENPFNRTNVTITIMEPVYRNDMNIEEFKEETRRIMLMELGS